MLGAAKAYAEANQAVLITPFILAGAMSPATVAGAATQTLAEALAGMAFCQLVRPGAPVVFGSFASSMSMQSGAPTFGTPEPALVLYVDGGAARAGSACRSARGGALTASKIADAQAAYESANTLQPTMLGGRELRAARGGLARGRPGDGLREVHPRRRPGGAMARLRARAWTCRRTARRWTRSSRTARASTSSGTAHTLANFETRVLAVVDRRQQQLRAVGARRREGCETCARTRPGRRCSPSTRRRRSTRRSTRSCASWIERKKASFPDSNA